MEGIDNQATVDLMTGTMGHLLQKLGEFLKQEHNLQTSMKGDIISLETQLRRLEDDLVRMPQAQQEDTHCTPTYYERRELPYDIEDIVDSLMLQLDDDSRQVTQPTITIQDNFSLETLENIKVRVKNLAAWHAANFVPTTTTISTVEPCLEARFKQVRQLVGVHKLRVELISRMSLSSQRLKIVSIWGAGGMGKTTLAKAVYEDIKWNFQCTAFVSVGPQPDTKKALRDILIHLDKKRYSDLNMIMLDEKQLTNELQRFLQNKRFLIVTDDIRDIPSWEGIKCALVDSDCGSRIITTSRVLDVAQSSGEVLELMPLSIAGSKELFYGTLCGRKDMINYDALDEQTTEYILQKCGCVPLAIIIITSLLAGKPQEEWTEVYNSIGFGHEDNIDTRKIIQFSYYDLPSHLKTCLLYLSIFPDDHVIEEHTLVWRLVAEGFLDDEEQGQSSLYKVGERYLYELVSRSMIQRVENENTNIRGWRVESMVLDWIRSVAKEQKFVNASGDWYDNDGYLFCHQSNNPRIMVIHNRVMDKPHDLARIWKRKVRSFSGSGCSISSSTMLLHPAFQALRILSLEGCKLIADSSDGLKNLIHLRYLGLVGMSIGDLPIEIGRFRYLQTLNFIDTDIGGALPPSVTQLRHLKCLRCFASTELELPPGMGNLTLLEDLQLGTVVEGQSKYLAEEMCKLTELRVLCLHTKFVLGAKWSRALVESLSKLQKIEAIELRMVRPNFWKHFVYRVTRRGGGITDPGHEVIIPGAFPKLRYMKMNTWLMSQPGSMPCLKSVVLLVHVRDLKDANFDFHDFYKLSYLRMLERAHVGINCRDAKMEEVEEAEAAMRCAVESHTNHPKLILYRIDRCVDQNQGDLDGKDVAVKLLHTMAQRPDYEKDFVKEFENLSRLNHANIVQLLGYCYEIKRICVEYQGKYVFADEIDRALCFDYMRNGSLQQHLHDESGGLDWQKCYKIIKGTCEGLKYLHKGLENPMFHLDLKPGNILLDENMMPKLADFGLSKFVSDNQTQATSSFLGTIGYCPPEHIERYYFSDKFDIFSLGVIMIEIITGPKGHGKAVEMGSQGFIDHVQENWRKRIHRATPGCTSPNCECQQVKRCIEIALECVHPDRTQRPDIEDITSRLNETENNTEESAPTSSSQNQT